MVLGKGVRMGTLYKLDACTIQCNSTFVKSKKRVTFSTSNGHSFWVPKGANTLEMKLPTKKKILQHQRLGHIGETGLKALKNKSLVEGLTDNDLEFELCEHWVYGKQCHVSFYSRSHNSFRVLYCIHLDVFSSVNVPSISRSVYFVSFIDDYSRTFVCFLRSKSEVFSKFKEFKSLIENQIGRKIKCLRIDNGGKFCSAEFDRFCKDHGIQRHKTTPYTPQKMELQRG